MTSKTFSIFDHFKYFRSKTFNLDLIKINLRTNFEKKKNLFCYFNKIYSGNLKIM